MTLARYQVLLYSIPVSRRFASPMFVLITLPALVMLLFTSAGCETTKQTWSDWSNAREARKLNLSVAFVPPEMPSPGSNGLVLAPGYQVGDGAQAGEGFDLAMRNPDFPHTYIETVYIDLSNPSGGVHVKWAGPKALECPVGPWRETPGRGSPDMDCDEVNDSNTKDSLCTPKGTFPVVGFADHLKLTPICLYATWVLWSPRFIAIHSHTDLPSSPASAGCVRVPYEAAKLIHNNSIVGVTLVNITGTWHRPLAKTWQRPSAKRWQRATQTK